MLVVLEGVGVHHVLDELSEGRLRVPVHKFSASMPQKLIRNYFTKSLGSKCLDKITAKCLQSIENRNNFCTKSGNKHRNHIDQKNDLG